MGLEVIASIVAITATAASIQQQGQAAKAQKKMRNEEKARNTAQQMAERRQQVREERIKRARVMQAAENTGTAGSSGELGAVSSIGSQLGANLGFNQSMIESGNRISGYAQQAANAQTNASVFNSIAGMSGNVGSIFGSSPTAPDQFEVDWANATKGLN